MIASDRLAAAEAYRRFVETRVDRFVAVHPGPPPASRWALRMRQLAALRVAFDLVLAATGTGLPLVACARIADDVLRARRSAA